MKEGRQTFDFWLNHSYEIAFQPAVGSALPEPHTSSTSAGCAQPLWLLTAFPCGKRGPEPQNTQGWPLMAELSSLGMSSWESRGKPRGGQGWHCPGDIPIPAWPEPWLRRPFGEHRLPLAGGGQTWPITPCQCQMGRKGWGGKPKQVQNRGNTSELVAWGFSAYIRTASGMFSTKCDGGMSVSDRKG